MLLTIAIPTYNRATYLRSLLFNHLAFEVQGYLSEVSLLISDNCSTDNTGSIIQDFKSKHPDFSINYFKQESNKGFFVNLLTTYELCNTDYIWFLSDDDSIEMHCLSNIIRFLILQKPTVLVLGTNTIDGLLTKNGIDVSITSWKDPFSSETFLGCTYISTLILKKKKLDFTYLYSKKPNLFPQITLSLLLLKEEFSLHSKNSFRTANRETGHVVTDFFDLYCIDIKEAIELADWPDAEKSLSKLLRNNLRYFIKLQFLERSNIFYSKNGFPFSTYIIGLKKFKCSPIDFLYISLSFFVSFLPRIIAVTIYIFFFSLKYQSVKKAVSKYKLATHWKSESKTSDL